MNVPILSVPIRYWNCPECGKTAQTQIAEVHVEFHDCPEFGNAGLPLVEVRYSDDTAHARQIAVPSEYGFGTAAIRTERLDGSNDVTVFPLPAIATSTT